MLEPSGKRLCGGVRTLVPSHVGAMPSFTVVNDAIMEDLRTHEGLPIGSLTGQTLVDAAHDYGIREPSLLVDEAVLRMLIAALQAAVQRDDGGEQPSRAAPARIVGIPDGPT